ncbi:MAG: alpha/beta fold hydrolase [Pseudomonadota bacterium]
MAHVKVYFGTNRLVEREKPARFGDPYNAEKPYCFRVGEVNVKKVGDSWRDADKAFRCGRPKLYPEAKGDEDAPPVLGSATLFQELRREMLENERDALVFLHGFANTFESAMERAAELGAQYLSAGAGRRGKPPLVFAFSWPSDGKTFGLAGGADGDDRRRWAYTSDRQDARASGAAMARCALRMFDYLAQLAADERCGQRVHLVAHSMGAWALRHAVQDLKETAEEANAPLRRIFDNAFLMAADLEDDALEREEWLAPLLRLARRVHVYHAENDTALSLSDIKPGQGARLGHYGPANMTRLNDRVAAVDCSDVSWTPAPLHVRHQYYRIAPEVVADVREALAGEAPSRIKRRVDLGGGRYRLRHDEKARKALRKE